MERPFAWERYYPPGVSWDDPIWTSSVPALLDKAVADHGDRTAIEYRDREMSFIDLGGLVDQAAAALLAGGIKRGQTLALYLPNTPFHPVCFFGGLKTGARIVMLSPLDAPRELAYKLDDSGARVLITVNLGDMAQKAAGLLADGHLDRVIVCDDRDLGAPGDGVSALPDKAGVMSWRDFARGAVLPATWPAVEDGDIALLQYTGGTTGRPKGAILTHANLTAATAIYETWQDGIGLTVPGQEKVLCYLPLFHIYALTVILLRQVRSGNEILMRLRFDTQSALRDIEEKRATIFYGVPTMWIAITNLSDIDTRDLSSLRTASSGGAPLPVEVGRRFTELTGMRLLGGWGMTESSPAGTNLPSEGPDKPGSIGVPMPGLEMGFVALDDPTRELGPGETGEMRIRGPNVTRGYWNRPEETEAAFADGYFLTGDIGYMDEDGFFFLVDRKKDMILSGGFNVYPQVIEQAIYEHPAVAEVLVIGVDDAYRGQSAKAFISLREGADALSLDALQAFLADKVGRHEMPQHLEIRDALPRTAVGKLSKIALRDEARAKARERNDP